MPGMDGLTVCKQIREHIACPILFLTARIESSDKIIGFQAGADDYIVKPFDCNCSGGIIQYQFTKEAYCRIIMASLLPAQMCGNTRPQFIQIKGLDRERIYELVWGLDGDGNSDTIMEHIRKIRAKFAAHTLHNYIETVWGCGYRWNA